MPLQKQKVQLSITDGLDTKTDEKNVLAARFLELENCVFTQTGSLSKRNGYNILSTTTTSKDTISNGLGLANYRNELLHFDGKKFYSYVDSIDQWTEKGSVVSVITDVESVINNSYEQTNAEYGTVNNLEVYAWEDSRGGVRYSALDRETGNSIVTDAVVDAGAADPKIIRLGSSIMILYRVGTVLNYRKVSSTVPAVLEPAVLVTNSLNASGIYDTAIGGERVFISWHNNVGGISLRFVDSSFVQSSTVNVAGEPVSDTMTVYCDCANNVQVYYYSGTEVKYFVYDYSLTTQTLAPTAIETVADVKHITAIETNAASQTSTVLYEIELATNNNFIRKNTVTVAGTVGTPEEFMRSVGLYSKIFETANDFYVVTAFQSDLQSTYFVFSLEGDLIGKIVPQNAGGYKIGPNLTEVYEISDEIFKLAVLEKHTLLSDNGNLFSLRGVQGATLDFQNNNHYLNAETADSLHIIGGVLQMYDGANLVEHGFSVFPENVQVSLGVGGGLGAGSYQYVAVYAWTDNTGRIHRSAPSVPVTVTPSAGQSATITVSTLRVTKKEGAYIEVYGTEVNGQIFYKLTTVANPLFNDKTVDSVQFIDTETDAQKLDNELLYTTGGVLDNIAPPASSLITTYRGRVILGRLGSDTLFYSKDPQSSGPVEFNDGLTIGVGEAGGATTALAAMDNYCIIFKERAIYAFSGEGPNNLGEQDDFRSPQLITSDAGCIDSNSVVEMPNGLMFKSEKGIYLLNRGLSVSYLGDRVERFNDQEITSATLLASTNQVRFTTADSVALVYDYYHNRWSTFTNHESLDSTIYDEDFVFVKADGRVFRETENFYQDGGQPIQIKIASAWIQVAGIQGFQRFYRMMLLGDYKSDHTLRVRFAYDFVPALVEEAQIDATALLDPTAYGEDSPYGAGSPYGGDGFPYQFEIFPQRQKCQAFRFEITDVEAVNFGESFTISNMALLIGIKTNLNRKSDSFKFASG